MSGCGKDYSDAATEKDDQYYDAQHALLKTMVGGECSTAEAFYAAEAAGYGVTAGVKGGVAASTGCETIAATFSRTINQMVNASCTLVETTMSSTNLLEQEHSAVISVETFAVGNVTVSNVMINQSTDFKIYSQNQFDADQTKTLLQELTTEIANDLSNAIDSKTDFPADVDTEKISIQINDVLNNNYQIEESVVETTMTSLNNLKFTQDANIKLVLFVGENANISNIVITQDMVGRAELMNIFGTAATSIVEQLGATGIVNTLKNTVTSTTKTTNINWTYVIPIICFFVAVIAVPLIIRFSKKRKMKKQMSKQTMQALPQQAILQQFQNQQPVQQLYNENTPLLSNIVS